MDRELLFLVKTIRSTGVCSVVLRPIRVRVHFVLCATRASRPVNLPMHQFVQGCLASIIKNLSPKNKTSLIAQAKGIVADDLQLGNARPLVRGDFQQKRPCDGDRRGMAWSFSRCRISLADSLSH